MISERQEIPSHNLGHEVETFLVRHQSAHNSRPPGAAGEAHGQTGGQAL